VFPFQSIPIPLSHYCSKQTTRAITINNCVNLKIKGLTIDYEALPFTQGKIVDISGNKSILTINLFDGYPTADT
jgi:hypothetical protein